MKLWKMLILNLVVVHLNRISILFNAFFFYFHHILKIWWNCNEKFDWEPPFSIIWVCVSGTLRQIVWYLLTVAHISAPYSITNLLTIKLPFSSSLWSWQAISNEFDHKCFCWSTEFYNRIIILIHKSDHSAD